MFLGITCIHLLSTSGDGDSTTSLSSLFQCLMALSVKKVFCNTQSKLPLAQLETVSSYTIPYYLGDRHLPHYNLLSGSCREQAP